MATEVTDADLAHLRRCVDLAEEAVAAGDFPFGSVLVAADGTVLAEDRNREETEGIRPSHPEFALARWAGQNMTPARTSRGDRLHLRRALPDVRRRPWLGRTRTHCLRDLIRADDRVAGRTGGRSLPGPAAGHHRGGSRSRGGRARPRSWRRRCGSCTADSARRGVRRARPGDRRATPAGAGAGAARRRSAGVNAGGLVVVALRADGPRERARRVLARLERVKHGAEVVPGRPAQVGAGAGVDVDAADGREHPPAPAGVLRLVVGEQPPRPPRARRRAARPGRRG